LLNRILAAGMFSSIISEQAGKYPDLTHSYAIKIDLRQNPWKGGHPLKLVKRKQDESEG
jgi:hypothetical protein